MEKLTAETRTIPVELYDKLNSLGLIPNEVREGNIGKSDYSKRFIQPWSIWIDYELNPWDADITKRILRTKEEPGMTLRESRIMDYKKIIHICKERIRQLELEKEVGLTVSSDLFERASIVIQEPCLNSEIVFEELIATPFNFTGTEMDSYNQFLAEHSKCGKDHIHTKFEPTSVGTKITVICPHCKAEKDITDYSEW